MYEGSDFGFVGGFDVAPMTLQNAAALINWYVERDEDPRAKEQLALLGCPGLNPVINYSSVSNGQWRGLWVLPGGTKALGVIGNVAVLITIQNPATQTSVPQFAATVVGTLLTNSGPVCIRDNGVLTNGVGGYAVIVDGTYGYYYAFSASSSVSFTAADSVNSPTLAFSGSLPNGLIVAAQGTLSAASGNIPVGTTILSVNTVALTLTMSNNSTGTNASDTITLTIPTFGQITDPGFLGADRIAFIEGWLIFNEPGTRTFFTTGPTPYQILFPGAFYSLKDSSTDNLVTLFENERELWLIGERTSEVWYNAGGANFAFSRIPGVGPQIGCAAKHSITRMANQLIWLGKNEQGENVIVVNEQYDFARVSTHAVDHAISQYPVVSDAIGYCYEEEGHVFYVLTFPTADATWVYDMTSKDWHQRASFNSATGTFHRHRSNCYMDFGNVRLVGDYQSGQIHQMSRAFYTDAGNPLVCLRRSPHVWSKQNRERVFMSQLQIEFTPGVGLQSGQGSNPLCMLRFSDDGGFSWSNQITCTIGAAGATKNRAIFRLLGRARDRVWEVQFSDPVPRDIIGATLYAEKTAA